MLEPIFIPFPELQTRRLLLRKVNTTDAEAVFEMRSNEEVMRYIDKPRATTLDDATNFINVCLSSLVKREGITWGIALKENPDNLIGTIGFWRLIKEHYRAEIGYMLHPHYWRKGIMKEALDTVIPFGFDTLKLHSIEAHINPANTASAAILTASGFVREAYFKEDYFYEGKFLDTAIYSRLQ